MGITRAATVRVWGVYVDNTAALAAGVPLGELYRTGDVLKVVHAAPAVTPYAKAVNAVEYVNNAAALAAGLAVGDLYRTGDVLKYVHAAPGVDPYLLLVTSVNDQADSYVLALTDANKFVRINNALAKTLTVPTNAVVAFDIGTAILVEQLGAGQVTITPAGGVTINSANGLKTRAQYSCVTLIKTAADVWIAFGDSSV